MGKYKLKLGGFVLFQRSLLRLAVKSFTICHDPPARRGSGSAAPAHTHTHTHCWHPGFPDASQLNELLFMNNGKNPLGRSIFKAGRWAPEAPSFFVVGSVYVLFLEPPSPEQGAPVETASALSTKRSPKKGGQVQQRGDRPGPGIKDPARPALGSPPFTATAPQAQGRGLGLWSVIGVVKRSIQLTVFLTLACESCSGL